MEIINEDKTQPYALYTLMPSLGEINRLLHPYKDVTIAYYDPRPAQGAAWLFLDTPIGVVKIFETFEPDIFVTIVSRASRLKVQPQPCDERAVTQRIQRGYIY